MVNGKVAQRESEYVLQVTTALLELTRSDAVHVEPVYWSEAKFVPVVVHFEAPPTPLGHPDCTPGTPRISYTNLLRP